MANTCLVSRVKCCLDHENGVEQGLFWKREKGRYAVYHGEDISHASSLGARHLPCRLAEALGARDFWCDIISCFKFLQ